MLNVLTEMVCEEEHEAFQPATMEGFPQDGPVMYVMTNPKKRFGAAVILQEKYLENVAEQIGGSYYILPSSIHELIAVGVADTGEAKSDELTQMEHAKGRDAVVDVILRLIRKKKVVVL